MKRILPAVFLFCLYSLAWAGGEAEELRSELRAVETELDAERHRYNAAKAELQRSELVARFLFPRLQARGQELRKKIDELEKSAKEKKKE